MKLVTWIVCVAAAAVTVVTSPARAQPAWDGLDELMRVAREVDISLVAEPKVDLSRVSPSDALLIVGPRGSLPINALTTFLREGGRVALLDDVGTGDRLLAAYQVARAPAPRSGVPALRGDANLLVSYPASEHPLVEGVSVLLTNRAAALTHPELKPVFTFGRSSKALVLAGAVGSGRLVAVGDGSLLINQLMSIPSQRRFAKNLLQYLARPGGRVWLVGPHAELEGTYGTKQGGLARIDGLFKRLSHPDLPPAVISLIALALAGIGVVLAAGTLPRRSPYVRPDLFPKPTVFAGFAGRVAAAERDGVNLVWSLLDYKRELEAELSVRLAMTGPFSAEEALRMARTRGLDATRVKELEALLASLERLSFDSESDERKARIGVSELRNVVRKGEELLGRLGNDRR